MRPSSPQSMIFNFSRGKRLPCWRIGSSFLIFKGNGGKGSCGDTISLKFNGEQAFYLLRTYRKMNNSHRKEDSSFQLSGEKISKNRLGKSLAGILGGKNVGTPTDGNKNDSRDQLPNVGTPQRLERTVEEISTIWTGKRLRGNQLVVAFGGRFWGAYSRSSFSFLPASTSAVDRNVLLTYL